MAPGCIYNLNLSEKNLQANIDADIGNPSTDSPKYVTTKIQNDKNNKKIFKTNVIKCIVFY